jgi:hypothetical protein
VNLQGYFVAVAKAQAKYPQWRFGQALFNVLAEARPDLSEPIRGTKLDPFHGINVDGFLEYVEREW